MMLSLKTLPYLHRPLKSILFSPSPPSSLSFSLNPKPYPCISFSSAAATMDPAAAATAAADTTTAATIEHVVLFKIRDGTEQSQIDAMISSLRSLSSLPIVSHLTAGPILRLRSAAASSLAFTHLLHSRYPSKPDLAAYSSHPDHVAVVKSHVLPICDDILALDWVAASPPLPSPSPSSALRLTLAKPRAGVSAADLVAAIEGMKGSPAAARAEQLSVGENFSPARAKGYEVGFLSVFGGLEQLDALTEDEGLMKEQKEKVRGLVEEVIVLDYVVPSATGSPSL